MVTLYVSYEWAEVSYVTRTFQLRVDVDELDSDDEERWQLATKLRSVLLDLDVDAIDPVPREPAPDETKGAEVAEAGSMIVTLAPTMLSTVVQVIRGWLGHRGTRSVKLTLDGDTLEVTGVSSADQQRLIEAWLRRR
jgi:hypothetical protein